MVGAGEDAARVLTDLRGVGGGFLGLPRRGGHRAAGLRRRCAGTHARAEVGAQIRQRQRARCRAGPHQAGRDACVRFARQAVEGSRRRAFGQGQDVLVQRIARRQAIQRVGHGALVAGACSVCKRDRAVRRGGRCGVHRHLLAAELQCDVLRAVAQRRVQERVVGRHGVELAVDGTRRQDRVLACAFEPAFRPNVYDGPGQVRHAADALGSASWGDRR
ncbi:hypothetical protein G6F62_013082 [Rhizopus arrhizus]|nr:hypothetical protein G6F62_013082 [Rhizopus arrhizus]